MRGGQDTFDSVSHQVAALMARGCTATEAAAAVGVSPRTLRRWIERGRRDPESRYAGFVAAVEAAAPLEAAGPMSLDEFKLLVARAIRRGSVPAMQVYLRLRELERGQPPSDARAGDPFAFADELAAWRGKRRGAS